MKKFLNFFFISLLIVLFIFFMIFHKRVMLSYKLINKFISFKDNMTTSQQVDINVSSKAMDYQDIVYKNTNSVELHLDVYSPINPVYKSSPVLMYVHGGCWAYGDKSIPDALTPILNSFREEGYTIISIEYELMNDTENFNKQICDVKDAVRWIYKNKDFYNLNTDEIGIIGVSSGAHISMLAAYSDENSFKDDTSLINYPSKVKYLIDCFGPTDLSLLNTSDLNPDLSNIFSSVEDVNKTEKKYNPINYVNKNIPYTLIIHGKYDELVPYKGSVILYDKCKKENAKSSLILLDFSSHDFSGINKNDIISFSTELLKFIIFNSPLK